MCEGAPVGWPHSEGRWRVPDLERPISDVQAAGEGGEGVARLAGEKELKGRVGEWEGTWRARRKGEGGGRDTSRYRERWEKQGEGPRETEMHREAERGKGSKGRQRV